jgi:hypothetical protein
MWYYHTETDGYFSSEMPFVLNGNQYPAGWLESALAIEIQALGLREIETVGTHKDPFYYTNTESLNKGVLTKSSTPKTNLTEVKKELKRQIDEAAGVIRNSYISAGEHVIREYDRAYAEAVEYKNAGYPASPVPLAISCWAKAINVSNTYAADNIITQGKFLQTVLDRIREIRLTHKASIDGATTVDKLISVHSIALAKLNALKNVS